jgi:hypothetical protein
MLYIIPSAILCFFASIMGVFAAFGRLQLNFSVQRVNYEVNSRNLFQIIQSRGQSLIKGIFLRKGLDLYFKPRRVLRQQLQTKKAISIC